MDEQPDASPEPPPRIRASDADREHVAALLQRHYTEGRLTLAEVDERVAAAYAARTYEQLAELTADLPAERPVVPAPPAAEEPDLVLFCVLLILCPPAGLLYWVLTRRGFGAASGPQPSAAPADPTGR